MTADRRNVRSEDGQAAVEFALIAPVLIVLLLGIVQGGITFHHYLAVTDAARAAARKAVVMRVAGYTKAEIETAARNAAVDLDQVQLGVDVTDPESPTFSKGGTTVIVTVTYPYSINVLGVKKEGTLTSEMRELLE
jgi:Flp pilus assembly protein TadG